MKKEKNQRLKNILEFINNESIEPRIRILNITIFVILLASAVSLIPMWIFHTGGIIFNILMCLGCLFGALFCIKYRRVNEAGFAITALGIFYILPSMYFSSGGINSAMPIWFAICSLLAYVLVDDKFKIFMFSAEIILAIICISIEYMHPELVTPLEGRNSVFSDVLLNIIIISFLLLFVFSIHERTDKRQRIILERQKEELIQKQKELEIAHNNDRMRLLEEQQRTLSEYHEIIAHAGIGIWFIKFQPRCPARMRTNDKMKQILGISDKGLNEEETYTYWHRRIVESDLPLVTHCLEEMIAGNVSEITYQWVDDEKGIRYVRCGGTAVIDEDGGILLRGYHSDVTTLVEEEERQKKQLAQARENAVTANLAKSTFLFNMSHDIRTPMNAILGFTHLMENHLEDPEILNDYLHKIESSGVYLLSIINNVLDMARIENGKLDLDLGYTDIRNDNKSMLDLFAEDISRKHLTLTHEIDIQHQYVMADGQRITQILVNLLSNAVKYTPDGGKIHLAINEYPCEKEGYGIYITRISDTGIGMSRQFQEHIFDSFARERTTTESGISGTGLGMAIVKKLVDKMGGTVTLESEVGKGSTFTVSLELKIADSPENYKCQNSNTDLSKIGGQRVLLAEDNDLNAEIAMAILEEVGITAERAADGVECIDMLTKADASYYDLILMDIQMPNLDGYQATRKIRMLDDERKANIPIIAITANAFAEDRDNALGAGMNGHLTKPIEIDKLYEALGQFL